MDLFYTVECYDRGDFEAEVQALINRGWKLINANSLVFIEPHMTQAYTCFHGFLLKEGEACQPEPVEGTSSISSIQNPKS